MSEYFTPDIEDIRVGYECETRYADGIGVNGVEWKKLIISDTIGFHKWQLPTLRTPYLTKEQIEAEGWKAELTSLNYFIRGTKKCFVKENRMGKYWDYAVPAEFQITYDTKNYILKIMYGSAIDDLTWFEGECKDINTFRYICKLLNI